MSVILRHRTILRSFVWWALASLVAIAVIELNGLLGLLIALVFGVVLGFLAVGGGSK